MSDLIHVRSWTVSVGSRTWTVIAPSAMEALLLIHADNPEYVQEQTKIEVRQGYDVTLPLVDQENLKRFILTSEVDA
jgi:hypothetical protein